MSLKENMMVIINSKLKKGMKLVVEVEDVLGDDIVSINVDMRGSNAALLKMLLSAMASEKRLAQFIHATATADEYIRVDAFKFNYNEKAQEGGES